MRLLTAGLLCSVVVGCATPPPARPRPAAPIPPTTGSVPALPPAAALPVSPPAAQAAVAAVPAAPASAPETAGVAARFPDPPLREVTPALVDGRPGFTSQAELQSLLRTLAAEPAAGGTRIRLLVPGVSQSGQPIEALLLSRAAELAPAELHASGRPTVLLIGQQHGDEPAGAEALLVLARQIAQGPLAPLLDRLNVIVLPRANPDGAQDGRRATASGLDANRDHLQLRTPEAQAIAALWRDYQPAVVVDAHEYPPIEPYRERFGAVARADVLLQYATTANMHEFVTRAAHEWFRPPLLDSLAREGLTVDWYHTLATAPGDRRVAMGGPRPDTGRNAAGLRHAVSLLIETRGVGLGRAHLARRVHAQLVAATSVLNTTAARADDLARLRRFVETETTTLACSGEVVVEAAPTASEYVLNLLDPTSGTDKSIGVAWESSLQLQPLKTRPRPCGYWLAAGEREAALRLRGLGLAVQRIEATGVVRGEAYRETSRSAVADTPGAVLPQVETVPALLDVVPGSWYVPLDQPLANLAVAALEPDTPSSYVANGLVSGVTAVSRVLARPGFRTSPLP
ncbi:M14 family metallocarboxypeptidase [Variovorax sp. YR752]|uniref:M14 family metallopeptidase n=1 Tax=Variovorax sp. YR752 TaxID=1884383 RepID=UPI00313775C1